MYIIVPDEKTTYHFLVTTFIKQAYEVLISEAQKEKNFRLPVRVNFVLDEFCNIPKVPDMPAMISAARSRNMRYFLVAQSMHQLKGKYGEDADTIKGNCDNWVFLTSKELSLLQEISALCGEIYTADGRRRAMILHARQYPIITEMADIDMYEAFKGYTAPKQRAFRMPQVAQFSVDTLLNDILAGKKPFPFTATHEMEITLPQAKPQKPKKKSAPKKKTIAQDTKLQEKAAQTYENLYGRKDDKK